MHPDLTQEGEVMGKALSNQHTPNQNTTEGPDYRGRLTASRITVGAI